MFSPFINYKLIRPIIRTLIAQFHIVKHRIASLSAHQLHIDSLVGDDAHIVPLSVHQFHIAKYHIRDDVGIVPYNNFVYAYMKNEGFEFIIQNPREAA